MTNSEATLRGTVGAPPPGVAGIPRRRTVSAGELRRWLTAEVQAVEGCEAVDVIGVSRLEKPGPDGCNWAHTLVVEPGGAPAPAYALACARAVALGRALFNLA